MKLYIKYMVSLRCKLMVKSTLDSLGITYSNIDLGLIETKEILTPEKKSLLKIKLAEFGLEILDSKKSILIEQIKLVVLDMVHHTDELPVVNYSEYISAKLDYDYTYLANIFSEVKGYTIQQYIIVNKIERAKELLLYNEMTLTEIAYKLNYSSVAHLSAQFKKISGLTPTFFKKLAEKKRTELENV